MVGWTISNLKSRLFVLLMQCLSLYPQFYAKSNFNSSYTYMLNFYVKIMYTKINKI